MKKLLILASLALGVASLSSPAGARNYDCSKAGNANKTACKSPGAATVAASKSTKTVATTKVTTTATARNYDCTKAGNKNKEACKTAVVPATSTINKSTTSSARNYDCTKAGNANKAACKTATGAAAPVRTTGKVTTNQTTSASYDCTKFYNKVRAVCRAQGATTKTSTSTVAPAPAPMNKPTVTRTRPATTVTRSVNSIAAGASAQCKDGSFSHAQHRTGACSHHGGVAKWL
jgi:hypothetical protein